MSTELATSGAPNGLKADEAYLSGLFGVIILLFILGPHCEQVINRLVAAMLKDVVCANLG